MNHRADLRERLLSFDLADVGAVCTASPVEPVNVLAYWNGPAVAPVIQARRDAMREFARNQTPVKSQGRVPAFVDVGCKPGESPRDLHHNYVPLSGQSCGEVFYVRAKCGDPLCVECMRRKSEGTRRRWLPALERMRHPKMVTLTIANFERARDARDLLQKSFRRFCDMSLGSRNLTALLDDARAFIAECDDDDKRARFATELVRLENRIRRKWRKSDSPVRLRDLLGQGFRSIEITHGDGFHFHIHAALDCWYLPHPFVRAAWKRATRGAGEVVDVRRIGRGRADILEVAKYLCKSWEMPEGLRDELRHTIHGMQRVKGIGGARPVEPMHHCPCCGREDCRAEHKGGELRTVATVDLGDVRAALVESAGVARWLVEDAGKGVWRASRRPLLDNMAVCVAEQRALAAGLRLAHDATGPPGGPAAVG